MVGVVVRAVAAGDTHSLALGWDGRVYSWGENECGQLGHGDELNRPLPTLVEGLEGVRDITTAGQHSLAVTHSGDVFHWGSSLQLGAEDLFRPVVVQGFGGVRVRRISAEWKFVFAIGEAGELFSRGHGEYWRLGHGDTQDQPSPKCVEALRDI
jgi:alpha-tubulin suppressor-like RCC1 family protein